MKTLDYIAAGLFILYGVFQIRDSRRIRRRLIALEQNMMDVFQDNNYIMNGDYRVYILDLLIQDAVSKEDYFSAGLFEKDKKEYLIHIKHETLKKHGREA